MNNIELIYDHYKDTCEIQNKNITQRNRLLLAFFISVILLLLFFFQENSSMSVLLGFLRSRYNIDLNFSIELIRSLLWLMLFYFAMQYYCKSINVERNYLYIHELEEDINQLYGQTLLKREKQAYLNKYPILLNFVDVFYKKVIPTIYILVILFCNIFAFCNSCDFYFSNLVGLIIGIACIVITVFYLHFIYKNNI